MKLFAILLFLFPSFPQVYDILHQSFANSELQYHLTVKNSQISLSPSSSSSKSSLKRLVDKHLVGEHHQLDGLDSVVLTLSSSSSFSDMHSSFFFFFFKHLY